MPFEKAARLITGTVLFLFMSIQTATAQTSLGFADPKDTTNLLEYRLPDWGYRTWDLEFDLYGGGRDRYSGDRDQNLDNYFNTGLKSDFNLYRESELRTTNVYADILGTFARSQFASSTDARYTRQMEGTFSGGGILNEYLGGGPFSLDARGYFRLNYSESHHEDNYGQGPQEYQYFGRSKSYRVGLGAGWGRVRDVTPLIRAQRLSERLTALGRSSLSPTQVQKIARVLATEQGYRFVFDRPGKSFWRDVLEPMLDPNHPLSPYEIFYLRDVMDENVGTRGQGTKLGVFYEYWDTRRSSGNWDYRGISRWPYLNFLWVTNPTLNHQWTLQAGVSYYQSSGGDRRNENVKGQLNLTYLWTIADRYRWDINLDFTSYYNDDYESGSQAIRRSLDSRLGSTFLVFMENSLALRLSASVTNLQESNGESIWIEDPGYNRIWRWSYGIGFEYYLDRVLY